MGPYDAPISAETAHGDTWAARIRARHEDLGADCPCGNGVTVAPIAVEPACDMREDCAEPVSMIDQKGYAYCTAHGLARRIDQPCRKLRGWEVRRLQRGMPLTRY